MNWLLDNIQFVIAFAAAIAWWMNKRRERTAAEEDARQQSPTMTADTGGDRDDEGRARRIQEEIRRKIAGRRTLPPVAPPPIVLVERSRPVPQAMPREMPRSQPVESQPRYDFETAILEQQRQMEAKLRMIDDTQKRAAEIRTGIKLRPMRRAISALKGSGAPGWVRGQMRDVTQVRRAIVMREILGPPKGLEG